MQNFWTSELSLVAENGSLVIPLICGGILSMQADPASTELIFKHLFDKLPAMNGASTQRLVVLGLSRRVNWLFAPVP